MGSDHRPRPYQGRALTNLAKDPFLKCVGNYILIAINMQVFFNLYSIIFEVFTI